MATISCPDVGQKLTDVPNRARGEVDGELATLDRQVTEAYQRLVNTRNAQARDANFVQNSILGPLKDKRKAILDRIRLEITRAGGAEPNNLDALAPCTGTTAEPQTNDGGQNGDGQNNGQNNGGGQDQNGNGGQQGGIGGQAGNGPVAADFVDITKVRPNVKAKPRRTGRASTGSFTTRCGVNVNKNYNTDNVIVAPRRHQRCPPHPRLRRQPEDQRVLQQRQLPPGRHQLPEQERPVVVLLAGAAGAGRHAGVRPEPGRRRQGGQRRPHPDREAGRDQVRRQPDQQGRPDAAVPAHHHR
ncbi:hypothetical protein GCM10020256_56070 [Streptomyces thermocoprophilus]